MFSLLSFSFFSIGSGRRSSGDRRAKRREEGGNDIVNPIPIASMLVPIRNVDTLPNFSDDSGGLFAIHHHLPIDCGLAASVR